MIRDTNSLLVLALTKRSNCLWQNQSAIASFIFSFVPESGEQEEQLKRKSYRLHLPLSNGFTSSSKLAFARILQIFSMGFFALCGGVQIFNS